jgi:hypothetical protein
MVTSVKNTNQKTMCLSWPMFLIKMNIFLVIVKILVKLNFLKNHDLL